MKRPLEEIVLLIYTSDLDLVCCLTSPYEAQVNSEECWHDSTRLSVFSEQLSVLTHACKKMYSYSGTSL